jgi:glutathione S-transferase
MRVLYHFTLCGFSRAIRVILAEKRLDVSLEHEYPWNVSEKLMSVSGIGAIPLLQDINGICVSGFSAIREYLEEVYPMSFMIGSSPEDRAESRQIADWMCSVFYEEVCSAIVYERVVKRFDKKIADRSPDTSKIRAAMSKIDQHMEYISFLSDTRNWLAGQHFSIADVYSSAFVSVLDYLGCINWEKHEVAKGWYARIKSRPSFREILKDNLSQVPPSKDYSNLDF